MIKAIRQNNPAFNPDPGVTRTLINGWWVEWTEREPTVPEVDKFLNPVLTADQKSGMFVEKTDKRTIAALIEVIGAQAAGDAAQSWATDILKTEYINGRNARTR